MLVSLLTPLDSKRVVTEEKIKMYGVFKVSHVCKLRKQNDHVNILPDLSQELERAGFEGS